MINVICHVHSSVHDQQAYQPAILALGCVSPYCFLVFQVSEHTLPLGLCTAVHTSGEGRERVFFSPLASVFNPIHPSRPSSTYWKISLTNVLCSCHSRGISALTQPRVWSLLSPWSLNYHDRMSHSCSSYTSIAMSAHLCPQ